MSDPEEELKEAFESALKNGQFDLIQHIFRRLEKTIKKNMNEDNKEIIEETIALSKKGRNLAAKALAVKDRIDAKEK